MNHKNSSNNGLSIGSENSPWRYVAPLVAGAALTVIGLSRRSKPGFALAAAGGAIAYLGWRTKAAELDEFFARGSVLINCSAEEAYRRYSNLEDLPTFTYHLESVKQIGDRQYRWVALGPAGIPIQWDAEIVDQRPNEFISWRSSPNSALIAAGSVRFEKAPGGRGTIVTATTHFDHPAGEVGSAVAKMFGKDPSFLMQQDLRRFKALIEAGEIPTTEGQPSGPRSFAARALQAVNPDRPQRHAPTGESHNKQRRTA